MPPDLSYDYYCREVQGEKKNINYTSYKILYEMILVLKKQKKLTMVHFLTVIIVGFGEVLHQNLL